MIEYINLLGAEDVSRAGYHIAGAAEQMERAASTLDSTMYQLGMRVDQWLCDLTSLVEKLEKLNGETCSQCDTPTTDGVTVRGESLCDECLEIRPDDPQ